MKVVINGGEPMKDCPTNWDQAWKWQDAVNRDTEEWASPQWKWDCGFKLDYDGPILRVGSRFYPPKTYYGMSWDGFTEICVFDKEVEEKHFDCETLEELKTEVERYVNEWRLKIERLPETENRIQSLEKDSENLQAIIGILIVLISFCVFTIFRLW